jgi:hypothetical protein
MQHKNIKQRLMKVILVGKYVFMIGFVLILSCSTLEQSDKKLNGKSIDYLTEKFGSPDSTVEFVLTKKLYEYQYGLLKYYPEPEGKDIHIKELVWINKHKRTVVWLHYVKGSWESIDNITWNPDKIKY